MNLATVIVGLIIALIIIWCVAGIVRSRKKENAHAAARIVTDAYSRQGF